MILILVGIKATAQSRSYVYRTIKLTTDTVIDVNKTASIYECSECVEILVGIDTLNGVFKPQLIWVDDIIDMQHLSGSYFSFYPVSGMPRYKGQYTKEGEKYGTWYYWKETGELDKKEIWQDGKLMNTVKSSD